jgi:hypothetical protein
MRQRERYQKRCERKSSVKMLKPMAMRKSKNAQFKSEVPQAVKIESSTPERMEFWCDAWPFPA